MTQSQDNKSIDSKIWDKEIFPKIEFAFLDVFDNIDNSNLVSLYKGSETKYNKAKLNYKKGHNQFLYAMFIGVFLPLSFLCFIFPFYFAWKKFKQLKNNKYKLQDFVNEAKENKLSVHKQITTAIDTLAILKKMEKILKYKHVGPITSELIKHINLNSMFDYSNAKIEQNPYTSSWGIFDDNKIIINVANQSHEIIQKTYTGTTMVPYAKTDSNGNIIYRTELVSATYDHPKPIFGTDKKSLVFLLGCSELQFSFQNQKGFLDGFKNNTLAKLENKEFDENFNWSYNNEVQFRMIFTPLAQEIFLNETRVSKKSYKVSPEDSVFKYADFIGNNYSYKNIYNYHLSSTTSIKNFNSNADFKYEEFKKDFLDDIQKSCIDQYKAMKFMWSIPYLVSEDHLLILEDIHKSSSKNDMNDFLPYYFLNELFGYKIKKANTETFLTVFCSDESELTSLDFVKADVIAKAYEIHKETTYVAKYSRALGSVVSVPIYYDDYVRLIDTATLYYRKIKNKQKTFINKFRIYSNDLDDDIINKLVQQLEDDLISLSIVDGYIAVFVPSGITLSSSHISIIETITNNVENNVNTK